VLNVPYAATSSEFEYERTAFKTTADRNNPPFTELRVFTVLDRLHATATGMDKIPAWFLRIASPFLAKSNAHNFNLSVETAVVQMQWKCATILPTPKVPNPATNADFRPISITPILTQTLENLVFRIHLSRTPLPRHYATPLGPICVQAHCINDR